MVRRADETSRRREREGVQTDTGRDLAARDLAARWLPGVLVWGIPVAAILASGYSGVAVRWVWPAAFTVMAGACLLNAVRCRRLHCYVTGPLFLAAAILASLHGWGIVPLGPDGYQWIANGAFVGALVLGCLPELVFGRYLRPRTGDPCRDAEGGSR